MKKWFGIGIMITAIVFMLFNLSSNNGNTNNKMFHDIKFVNVVKKRHFDTFHSKWLMKHS